MTDEPAMILEEILEKFESSSRVGNEEISSTFNFDSEGTAFQVLEPRCLFES